jgi:hypothetical protein
MVMARFIYNDRLTGALMAQALSALGSSPGARALYDAQRAAGVEHNAALQARQPARRHPARMPHDTDHLRCGPNLDLEVTCDAAHPQIMRGTSLQARRAIRRTSARARTGRPPK